MKTTFKRGCKKHTKEKWRKPKETKELYKQKRKTVGTYFLPTV